MDSRARDVVRIGDALFDAKRSVDSLWQEIALNFFPKRATFTSKRDDGDEYADHLFSSNPSQARRELGNMLGEFLRPDKFFGIHVDDEELDERDEERAFLEMLTTIQWRAMNDPVAQFVTAAIQADHDFVTFGNAVEWFGLNLAGDALLFKNYHLRDNAWSENAEGVIDCNHRNWAPTARQLKYHFPKTHSKEVEKACEKDPEKTFPCRHVVMPSRLYRYQSKGGKQFPFVSLYLERESEVVLEEVGLTHFPYIISRWQRVSDSPFGTSMTTDVLLPDGRTLQVIMRTLREAGESYVNPPLIAIGDAIRGDIALYPGGITTADREYDERLGEVLRPITQNSSGFPIGVELAAALKEDIRKGWLLDKIQLPETNNKMTATEIRRRVQEHIRASAPIAKPIQRERNHPQCDGVFQLLRENGAFPLDRMPESLAGKELKFKFRSPLDELAEQNEADIFVDVRNNIIVPSMQLEPLVADEFDLVQGTRDAARAAGFKQKWFKSKEAREAARQQRAEEIEAQETAQGIADAGAVAEQAGRGIEAVKQALSPAEQRSPAARRNVA